MTSPQSFRSFLVDAFVGLDSASPLQGNPAAVVVLSHSKNDGWLQRIAKEFNLSETAFVVPIAHNQWHLRWFTPQCEVNLCGHATLATAFVLVYLGLAKSSETVQFETRSGVLKVKTESSKFWLDFPLQKPIFADLPAELAGALGLKTAAISLRAHDDWLLEIENQKQVENLQPDFALLKSVSQKLNLRGVIVTAKSENASFDFVSRFFAPAIGIDEDPVTGSAFTKLAPYWSEKLGKTELRAKQVSARGGEVLMNIKNQRVWLGGAARLKAEAEVLD